MVKKNIKLDKGVKITLILLAVYTGIVLAILLPIYLKKQRENIFIMTDRYKIKYEKRQWKKITNSDDYKLKEFDIYQDNTYFGKYKILFSSHFTLINDNDEIVKYNGYIFAKSGSLKLKLYNYSFADEFNSEDEDRVKQAINKVGFDSSVYYSINQKIIFNNNNDNEIIFYHVNNIKVASSDSLDGITGPIPNSSGKNFAILFMYKNGKIYIIDKNITEKKDFKIFEVLDIVDIKEDNELELIYALSNRFSNDSDCVKLYSIAKNKELHNFCEE